MSERLVRPLTLPELSQRAIVEAPAEAPAAQTENPLRAIREAHNMARTMVARAEARVAELEAAAHEAGTEQGVRMALEKEGPALRDAAAALAEAARLLDGTREDLRRSLAETLPEIAVGIAERILRRELAAKPENFALLVRDALAAVLPAARIEIRLHPDDVDTLDRHRDLLADSLGGVEMRIESSADVGRGGIVVETESFTLGAGLPQQLARALALLTGADE